MRRRLRKKRHRAFLTTVCAYVVTFDDSLRQRLLQSEPMTPFQIDGRCSLGIHRLMRRHRLRYLIAVVSKLAPATAVVVYWAEEFPSVRDEAIIFSRDDLSLNHSLQTNRVSALSILNGFSLCFRDPWVWRRGV